MDRRIINDSYKELDYVANDIFNSLFRLPDEYSYKIGYFNYRYYKDNNSYDLEYYPIPVISILNICDIEIDFDQIRFVCKIKHYQALSYDYYELNEYEFDLYELDNQGSKLYKSGESTDGLSFLLSKIDTKELGITFYFDKKNLPDIIEFISFLDKEGFYY